MIVIRMNGNRKLDGILNEHPDTLTVHVDGLANGANEGQMEVAAVIEIRGNGAQVINLGTVGIKLEVVDFDGPNNSLVGVAMKLDTIPKQALLTMLVEIDGFDLHQPKAKPFLAALQFMNYD